VDGVAQGGVVTFSAAFLAGTIAAASGHRTASVYVVGTKAGDGRAPDGAFSTRAFHRRQGGDAVGL